MVIDRVKVRAARGGEEDSPVIVSIPRRISKAANLVIGDYLRIYTDGNKICLDREQIPEI
jgi:hypothetical protein